MTQHYLDVMGIAQEGADVVPAAIMNPSGNCAKIHGKHFHISFNFIRRTRNDKQLSSIEQSRS